MLKIHIKVMQIMQVFNRNLTLKLFTDENNKFNK